MKTELVDALTPSWTTPESAETTGTPMHEEAGVQRVVIDDATPTEFDLWVAMPSNISLRFA